MFLFRFSFILIFLLILGCSAEGVNGNPVPINGNPVPTPNSSIGQVSTLAGSIEGFADGPASNAQFARTYGLDVDATGNVYVADRLNHRIRKVSPNGIVSTVAGSTEGYTDGPGVDAQFRLPRDVAVDTEGNLYVSDAGNVKIRKITPNGIVSTLAGSTEGSADGLGAEAQFRSPFGIDVDKQGNVYVAEYSGARIRKITPEGEVTTIAGTYPGFLNGSSAEALFNYPTDLAVDSMGNIYVADHENHKIRKITPNGIVSTLAGSIEGFADGIYENAMFAYPYGIAVDEQGNVYVGDQKNHKIRKITPNGIVSTLAGSTVGYLDGPAEKAMFDLPVEVAVDSEGNVYVGDIQNSKIRKITLY